MSQYIRYEVDDIILNKNIVLDTDDGESFEYYDNYKKMYEKFINIIKNNNYILNIIEKELYVNE